MLGYQTCTLKTMNPTREQFDLEQMRQVHESHDRSCARRRVRNWYAKGYANVVRAIRTWRK